MRERTRIEPLIDRCEPQGVNVLDVAKKIIQFAIHPGKAIDGALSELSAGMGIDSMPQQAPTKTPNQQ